MKSEQVGSKLVDYMSKFDKQQRRRNRHRTRKQRAVLHGLETRLYWTSCTNAYLRQESAKLRQDLENLRLTFAKLQHAYLKIHPLPHDELRQIYA